MFRKISFLLLGITLVFCSCDKTTSSKKGRVKHSVIVAGSTSVMPFSEKLAEYFVISYPDIVVDIQGGGSTAGIQAVVNGTVDIGMSSRQLNESEKSLKEIVICHDGISIIVHPSNPVHALSLTQVRDIYSGKIANWKTLGWIDRKIDAVTREEGSGTRGAFEELVMKETEINDGIMVQDSNGSVKEVIATDPYAIGYISLGLLDKRVKSVTVDGANPTVMDIQTGRYRIVRPFLYITNGEPDAAAKEFINFVLSREGQRILKKEGLVTLYD